MIAKLILLITTAHAIYSHSQQDIIREKHGDLYLGEAFLSADQHLTDLWFELTGQMLQNAWKGFLSGLYNQSSQFFQCTTHSTLSAAKKITQHLDQSDKEVFFLQLAMTLREFSVLVADIRANCEVDKLIKDIIVFCKSECQPQKLMSRVAVNMTPIGEGYQDLLKVLYNQNKAVNLNQEMAKVQLIGEKIGKIVRVAVSFDRLERLTGEFAEYLTDDEDFD